MEGWPDGWSFDAEEGMARTKRAGAPYIIYGAREGCRSAAWAIEGGEPAMDREALAMALHAAYAAGVGREKVEWGVCGDSIREVYRSVVDEATRLLSFEPRVGRAELRARIEELEQRNSALTATTNAALERAKEAEDAHDEMLTRHTLALTEALGYANGAHFGELLAIVGQRTAAMDERDNRIGSLIETSKAAAARAEEAQMRAQKAEEERDVLRNYDSPFEAEADGLRAEVARLRRALDAIARGAAHMADAVSAMAGSEEGAP